MKPVQLIVMAFMLVTSVIASPTIVLADEELPMVSGEIRKVKAKSGKITIRHEPIPNLDMPGMSMVFRVDEGIDVSQFSKGEKVKFSVIERDGKFVIVFIDKSE